MCPAQQNFCVQYSITVSYTLLCSTSFQMCSCNDIPSVDVSTVLCILTNLCSSFVVAHISLVYNIAGKMVLLKRLTCRALCPSFILVNAFHPHLILYKISASMSQLIFTLVDFHFLNFVASHQYIALWYIFGMRAFWKINGKVKKKFISIW